MLGIERIEKPNVYFCTINKEGDYDCRVAEIKDAENISIVDDGKYVTVNDKKVDLDDYRYELVYSVNIVFKNKNSVSPRFSCLEEAISYRDKLVDKDNGMVSDTKRFEELNKMLKELFLYE